jgi:hypothetical protein
MAKGPESGASRAASSEPATRVNHAADRGPDNLASEGTRGRSPAGAASEPHGQAQEVERERLLLLIEPVRIGVEIELDPEPDEVERAGR